MSSRRLHCPHLPAPGAVIAPPAAESAHAVRVLRARVGDAFTLLDGAGTVATAEVLSVPAGRRGELTLRVLSSERVAPPALAPWLLLAPPRAPVMSTLLRQVTELGVHTIAPIICERAISRPDARAVAGWERDCLEALKQSGNPFLPRLLPPRPLAEVVAGFSGPLCWGRVPDPVTADQPAPAHAWRARLTGAPAPVTVGLAIGPEGDFSPAEAELLRAAGAHALTVGPWVMRVETAAVALLASLWSMSA